MTKIVWYLFFKIYILKKINGILIKIYPKPIRKISFLLRPKEIY
jgi:hypothetical protein